MLQGADGLPLHETPPDYPLRIDWDGILADDTDHPDDIVRRVRDVFELIWKDRAEAIEQEACEILGVEELRDYFRKPSKGGFWDDHVSRYSKSRRKAPIYWLLQSKLHFPRSRMRFSAGVEARSPSRRSSRRLVRCVIHVRSPIPKTGLA